MAARQVRALLMGGQACVFYGAAEFSRARATLDNAMVISAAFTGQNGMTKQRSTT